MKINQLIDIYNLNEDVLQKATSRRDVFGKLGSLGKTLAMAAVPFGLAATAGTSSAYAQNTSTNTSLNFALLLEFLEAEFYVMGVESGVIPAGKEEHIFKLIRDHEVDHVEFLKVVLNSLGLDPIDKPEFDFTAGGNFDPFNDYNQFLALSQAFEDTGVRAYKGQATSLMRNGDLLTAALQIHSVEARHASEVRRLRGIKGWITGNERGVGMPAATQAIYDGEENVEQGGVDVTTITDIGNDGVTEAFDEPLNRHEVLAIAGLFLA